MLQRWRHINNAASTLWTRVTGIGVHQGLTLWEQKRVRLLNGLAAFSLILFPFYLLRLLNSPDYVTFWLYFVIMCLNGFVLVLTYLRLYNTAVWYFLLVGTVFYAFDSIAKKHDGAEYTLITYGLVGMMFLRDFRIVSGYFALNVAVFFWVRYAQTVIPPFLYIPEMTDLYTTNTFTGILTMFAVVYYFRQDNRQEILLEQRNNELRLSLNELHAAQAQLVQREKLASLGELTAGIAHEIQNPLNFVNNFAELSGELLVELTEERAKGPDGDRDLEGDLVADLQQNVGKIFEHGQRAAAIVRSMLEHSRASTGQRELTDINALCAQYLQLSFNDFQARGHPLFPCHHTAFDPTLPKFDAVPQDLGRVLLNLLNNAFYAVYQQQQRTPPGHMYAPEVRVRTQRVPAGIEVRVHDNGGGIPNEVRNKIFQPFFTTKPTGSGTGLGLSLSYDIITKGYGGTLTVQSEPGQGAEFVLVLPG